MISLVMQGILIPFAGTALGAACVFFMKKSLNPLVQRALTGFAAGVMVAASIWSLLIPAMEQAQDMGKVGATQDLLRGIEKLMPKEQPAAAVQERVIVTGGADNKINSLLD